MRVNKKQRISADFCMISARTESPEALIAPANRRTKKQHRGESGRSGAAGP